MEILIAQIMPQMAKSTGQISLVDTLLAVCNCQFRSREVPAIEDRSWSMMACCGGGDIVGSSLSMLHLYRITMSLGGSHQNIKAGMIVESVARDKAIRYTYSSGRDGCLETVK